MTTFNIGTQNAASIQNVAGDSVIEGGVHASAAWETIELRNAIGRLQEEAVGLGLSAVDEALSTAASEAAQPNPDKERVADHLGAAARGLKEAGALADAGTSLVGSLRRAASVVGPVGAAVLALL
jgi:hypothetical protein